MSSGTMLIFITILGIALLLFLVMKSKLQAFVALLISSLFIGIASGMDLSEVIDSIESGMGGTLGFIVVVVGLGAMFGVLLRASGGAERLASTLIHKFCVKKAQWALGLTGFIISIPIYYFNSCIFRCCFSYFNAYYFYFDEKNEEIIALLRHFIIS